MIAARLGIDYLTGVVMSAPNLRAVDGGYLTVANVAVLIGRTDERVRQFVNGFCGCDPLPAERLPSAGCCGAGRIVTRVESFMAWQASWGDYPGRW